MVGFYIVECEQNGEDRAQYGTKLLSLLAKALKSIKIKGLDERSLRDCRTFYQLDPQIWGTVSPKLEAQGLLSSAYFSIILKKLDKVTDVQPIEDALTSEILLSHLSFSHFVELLRADTPLKSA